jgi:predicted alpha/beta hydrolase family esterase
MQKIIFIQGIHNFKIRNYIILKALESLGTKVYYFPMFYSVYQTDKHIQLIDEVNALLTKEDGRFILIGHSFGGIICYSLKKELYAKIDTIITIASPHLVPFAWFKKILANIPYKPDVIVPKQISYGFYCDGVVPYIFTKYPHSQQHTNLWGTHNTVLNSNSLILKLLK